MSTRRQSVCLFCQARQSAIGRRRLSSTPKHRLETAIVALRTEDHGLLFSQTTSNRREDEGEALSREAKSHASINGLGEVALSFEALYQHRDLRLQILRSLSNPWPEVVQSRPHARPAVLQLPEAKAAIVPHSIFRVRIKQASGPKPIRQILRNQLLRCERPKEILRVVAVAMQHKHVAENLAVLHEPIMRALYRCRQHVSDPEVLQTLNTIVTRFRYADIPVDPMLSFMALKFAARSRSLPAMKRHLKIVREQGLHVTSNVFRSVIAKFSIGHRGLGEIRNGRWKRRDLLQVLTGFDDAKDLPSDKQYHLGSFLDRNDWQFLHGWVAVLARCKDSDSVWQEWQLWKASSSRTKPKKLNYRQGSRTMTTRLRGDYWFLEQMTHSGDIKRAWQMLSETGILFRSLNVRIKDKLLEGLEFATLRGADLRDEMLDKYDRELRRVEEALGVRWVSKGNDGEGQHELFVDQEEALDRLGAAGWTLDDDYGYPWETSPIVPEGERSLHDATETQ